MSSLRLSAYESEWIKPFPTIEEILDQVKFRLSKSEPFQTPGTFQWSDQDAIDPELSLDLTNLEAIKNAGYKKENLKLYVLVRDKNLALSSTCYEVSLNKFEACNLNLNSWFPSSHIDGRLEIEVLITPAVIDSKSHALTKLGSVQFTVDTLKNASEFPKEWRNPEEFKEFGMSADTVWYLNWRSEDIDEPIEKMVSVWLNTKYKTQLNGMSFDTKQKLYQLQMLASILTDIMAVIFGKAVKVDGFEQRAAKSLLMRLTKEMGITKDEIINLYDTPNYYSKLNAWASSLVSLGVAFEGFDYGQ